MLKINILVLAAIVLLYALSCVSCGCGDDDDDAGENAVDDDTDDDTASPDEDAQESAYRTVISLNGTWEVEQGDAGSEPPAEFNHVAPVPALLNSAEPPFAQIGETSDLRRAFWYRTTFKGPEARDIAILNIHKAKYGIAVWLNEWCIGGHLGSYTLASFDVTHAVRPGMTNTLLVRVGATRENVPAWVPAGQDAEKQYWLPGIYDDVQLIACDSPRIVRVKVEPDIDHDSAKVIVTLKNDHDEAKSIKLTSAISEWENPQKADGESSDEIELAPGQELKVEQIIPIENVRLWSCDDPFLYEVETRVESGGKVLDNLTTRFGMRKAEWRSGDQKGFYLNNERMYLRGSNITLHRFFEDPLAGALPWDEQWVRKLLTEYPQKLHWNSFRISIGRAPNFWYDIADEEGLIIADEFQMWDFIDNANKPWSEDEMAVEFAEWIQESWNHPSIAWWDSSNESFSKMTTRVVDRVRDLDPTRQWENGGFKAPHGDADPIEDHPYVFFTLFVHNDVDLIDENDGLPPQGGLPTVLRFTWDDPEHPYINNEYGWLWINRDGSPTFMTLKVYYDILGGVGPFGPEIHREAYAYLVGGLTEFWRAKRGYEAVLHFTYLGYSRPWGSTSDNFIDVENLVLEPRWFEYAQNAFAPLMVYLDTWRESYTPESVEQIPVQVINDYDTPQTAVLKVMAVDPSGNILAESDLQPVSLDPLGAADYQLELQMPDAARYMLFAKLTPDDQQIPVVWSRRKVGFENAGIQGVDPGDF